MRWNTTRILHSCLHTCHLHYFSCTFLLCSTLFYASVFFVALPVAFAQTPAITIQITGSAQPPGFSPALLTVHINEKVVFINHALPASSSTLTADDGSFSSPPIATGAQWAITFHTPGSHTYHATSSAQTITGELLVVAKNVQLLPTPNPLIEATVTALIKNGQNPPDTIIIAAHKQPAPPGNSLLPVIILVIGVSVSLTLLSVLGISFYKHRRQRAATTNDDDIEPEDDASSHEYMQKIRTTFAKLKQFLQSSWQSLLSKMKKDEDEDEDEYEDEDEDEDEA